jgi:hypothetical protein
MNIVKKIGFLLGLFVCFLFFANPVMATPSMSIIDGSGNPIIYSFSYPAVRTGFADMGGFVMPANTSAMITVTGSAAELQGLYIAAPAITDGTGPSPNYPTGRFYTGYYAKQGFYTGENTYINPVSIYTWYPFYSLPYSQGLILGGVSSLSRQVGNGNNTIFQMKIINGNTSAERVYIELSNSSFDRMVSRLFTGSLVNLTTNPLPQVQSLINQIHYDRRDSFVQDPIDTSTGSHVINRNLLTVNGARPISIGLDYNSQLPNKGPFRLEP